MRVHDEGSDFPLYSRRIVDGDILDADAESQRFAHVHAGFAVVLETVGDLDVIEAVVAEFMPGGERAYEELLPILRRIDENSESWRRSREELRLLSDALLENVPDDPGEASSIQMLYVAVRAIRELWEASWDQGNINIALSLHPNPLRPAEQPPEPDEFHAGDVLLTLGHQQRWPGLEPIPVLMLKPGSLLAGLGLQTLATGTKWILTAYGTARAFFKTSQEAADFFVGKMREKALRTARALPRLDALSPAERQSLRNADHVVVLLHGLFSTDAGTFDGLLDSWDKYVANNAGGKDQGVYWVGWPHDTLATISENARDLHSLLAASLRDVKSDIFFVCHSRGGLLARAACQDMFDRDSWDRRLKGCVTFGSPHNGADLARNPLRTAGGYALVYGATGSAKAFDSLLIYLHHKKRIDGIDDLAPTGNPASRFLQQLEDSENNITRRPHLVAVGGDVTTTPPAGGILKKKLTSLMRWGNRALVGGGQHDRVVTTASSIPQWADDHCIVPVDHFTYFNQLDARPGLDKGIDGIRRAFGI